MCVIAVSGIQGHESAPGQGIRRITVHGTASNCSAVSVSVHQTQPVDVVLPDRQGPVDANGDWAIDFSVNGGDFSAGDFVCGRGNKYAVDAVCVDDPHCGDNFSSSIVTCGDCPVVTAQFAGVRPSDVCDDAGQREVGITMLVVLGTSATATVTMELQVPGSNAVDVGPTTTVTTNNTTIPATGPFVVSLAPGSYIVRARFADTQCPPQEFTLNVPACPELVCPQVDWSAEVGGCDGNGRHPVRVTAAIVFPGQTIAASMLDDQGQVIASGTQDDDLTLVSATLSLGGGDHDFSIEFDDNVTTVPDECRPDLQNTVSLEDCGAGGTCPVVDWNPAVGGCNDDGTRNVTVGATVTSFGPPVTATLNDPQDNQLDTGTTPANGTVTLNSGTLTLPAGNHTFRVAFTGGLPGGCSADDTNVVTVADCDGGAPRGGNESVFCAIVRILSLIVLVAALGAVLVAACTQSWVALGIAIAAAVAAAALLIAWAIWCAPDAGCDVFQSLIGFINALITAAAVIAAIAGLLALLVPENAPMLPCLISTVISAASEVGFLSVLQLILWQIFLARPCEWRGKSIYVVGDG